MGSAAHPADSRSAGPAARGRRTFAARTHRAAALLALVLSAANLGGSAASADVLVASFGDDRVLRYDDLTGSFLGEFVSAGLGGLDGPWGMTWGPDGHLYVAATLADAILRFHGVTGAFIDAFVPPGSGGLQAPVGLSFGPDGNLYATDGASYDTRVWRFDGATGAPMGLFAAGFGGYAYGLQFGPDGDLYVASRDGNAIVRYDAATGALLGVHAWVYRPRGILFESGGDLLATSGEDAVVRCDSGGVCAGVVVPGSGGLSGVSLGLMLDPSGHLLVTSDGTNEVLRYDATSGASLGPLVAAGAGGLTGPEALLAAPAVTAIDIKPGSASNPVNPRARGLVPVAILGSAGFDTNAVDVGTLRFGPGDASPAHSGHPQDIDGDGWLDLVVHFATPDTGIVCGATEAILRGSTTDGRAFHGVDSLTTPGCH